MKRLRRFLRSGVLERRLAFLEGRRHVLLLILQRELRLRMASHRASTSTRFRISSLSGSLSFAASMIRAQLPSAG
jgi:hypothetical protein